MAMLRDPDDIAAAGPVSHVDRVYAAYAREVVINHAGQDTRELVQNYVFARQQKRTPHSNWDEGKNGFDAKNMAIALKDRALTGTALVEMIKPLSEMIAMDIDAVHDMCAAVIDDEPGLYTLTTRDQNSQSTLDNRFLALGVLKHVDAARHTREMAGEPGLQPSLRKMVNIWSDYLIAHGDRLEEEARSTSAMFKKASVTRLLPEQISAFKDSLLSLVNEAGIVEIQHAGGQAKGILRAAVNAAGIGTFAYKAFPKGAVATTLLAGKSGLEILVSESCLAAEPGTAPVLRKATCIPA